MEKRVRNFTLVEKNVFIIHIHTYFWYIRTNVNIMNKNTVETVFNKRNFSVSTKT